MSMTLRTAVVAAIIIPGFSGTAALTYPTCAVSSENRTEIADVRRSADEFTRTEDAHNRAERLASAKTELVGVRRSAEEEVASTRTTGLLDLHGHLAGATALLPTASSTTKLILELQNPSPFVFLAESAMRKSADLDFMNAHAWPAKMDDDDASMRHTTTYAAAHWKFRSLQSSGDGCVQMLNTLVDDPNCRAGCRECNRAGSADGWAPSGADECTLDCGHLVESFFEACTLMPDDRMDGLVSFYDTCIEVLYLDHPEACLPDLVVGNTNVYLQTRMDALQSGCTAGTGTFPNFCPPGCKSVVGGFLDACRDHLAQLDEINGAPQFMDDFSRVCEEDSSSVPPEYFDLLIDMIVRNGCRVDISVDQSSLALAGNWNPYDDTYTTIKGRRAQDGEDGQADAGRFLSRPLQQSTECAWEELGFFAEDVDFLCCGDDGSNCPASENMPVDCNFECMLAVIDFDRTCGRTFDAIVGEVDATYRANFYELCRSSVSRGRVEGGILGADCTTDGQADPEHRLNAGLIQDFVQESLVSAGQSDRCANCNSTQVESSPEPGDHQTITLRQDDACRVGAKWTALRDYSDADFSDCNRYDSHGYHGYWRNWEFSRGMAASIQEIAVMSDEQYDCFRLFSETDEVDVGTSVHWAPLSAGVCHPIHSVHPDGDVYRTQIVDEAGCWFAFNATVGEEYQITATPSDRGEIFLALMDIDGRSEIDARPSANSVLNIDDFGQRIWFWLCTISGTYSFRISAPLTKSRRQISVDVTVQSEQRIIESQTFRGQRGRSNGGALFIQDSYETNRLALEFGLDNDHGSMNFDRLDLDTIVHISSCSFDDNQAEVAGGALYSGHSNVNIQSSRFSSNEAREYGGAVYIGEHSRLFIALTSFLDNTAGYGGALYIAGNSGVDVLSGVFSWNFANDLTNAALAGGDHITADSPSRFRILNTTFQPFMKAGESIALNELAGCDVYPCGLGWSCSYQNYSTFCAPCPGSTVGLDGISCSVCAPGFEPTDDRSRCQECSNTTYSSFGVECIDCATGIPNQDRTNCAPCPANQRVNSEGDGCEFCPIGKQTDAAHFICVDCPAGKAGGGETQCVQCQESELVSGDRSACDCRSGYFSPDGNRCVRCSDVFADESVACPGGPRQLAQVFPSRSHWISEVIPVTPNNVYRCLPADVCSGLSVGLSSETNNVSTCATPGCCKPHHTGPLCGTCSSDRFIKSNGRCVECLSTNWLVVVGALAAYVALAKYLQRKSVDLDADKMGSTLAIATFYVQSLVLFSSNRFYGIGALVDFDISSAGEGDTVCKTLMSPFQAAVVSILAIPVFLVAVAAFFSHRSSVAVVEAAHESLGETLTESASQVIELWPPDRLSTSAGPSLQLRAARKRRDRAVLEVALFCYMGTAKKALSVLWCRSVDGESLVAFDLSQPCHDMRHMLLSCLAVLVLLCYTIGLPMMIFRKAREDLKRGDQRKSDEQTTFWRVICLFKRDYEWWMAWLLLRRALLAATFLYGQLVAEEMLVGGARIGWRGAAFMILVVSSVLQTWYLPFKLDIDNKLEQIILLMLVLALYVDVVDTSTDDSIASVVVLGSIVVVFGAIGTGDTPITQTAAQKLKKVSAKMQSACPCFDGAPRDDEEDILDQAYTNEESVEMSDERRSEQFENPVQMGEDVIGDNVVSKKDAELVDLRRQLEAARRENAALQGLSEATSTAI